jgi:hypothetical protein
MSAKHNEFVHQQNIKDFRKKLETETVPATRVLLAKLLAEEVATSAQQCSKRVKD